MQLNLRAQPPDHTRPERLSRSQAGVRALSDVLSEDTEPVTARGWMNLRAARHLSNAGHSSLKAVGSTSMAGRCWGKSCGEAVPILSFDDRLQPTRSTAKNCTWTALSSCGQNRGLHDQWEVLSFPSCLLEELKGQRGNRQGKFSLPVELKLWVLLGSCSSHCGDLLALLTGQDLSNIPDVLAVPGGGKRWTSLSSQL